MSVTLKRIASCLIVVCLTVAILAGLTNLTENKGSVQKYMQFFQQEADFDVLFMGSSKVINGVLPMELWNDYGIVSYNMGGHANTLPTSYWVLRNALDYTTPKCVVIDCLGSGWDSLIASNFSYSHLSFDAFPLSPTKIQAVYDLIDPEAWDNPRAKRMELLWNFSIYHSNWNTVNYYDFFPYFTYQKGAEPRVHVSLPAEMASVSPDSKCAWDVRGTEYLIKAIELCKERGIDVILVNIPYPATEGELIAANTVADIAAAYDVQHLNFFHMGIVDYRTDMYDPDSHLNPSGALKITDYLGKLLSEQYGIPDRRTDPAYVSWHEDAGNYQQEKVALFENAASAWNYWMLLSDDDFSFVAEVSEAHLQQDEVLTALLHNAGIQPEQVTGRCIIAADRTTGAVSYTPYDTLVQPVQTALGPLCVEDGCLKLNEETCWEIPEPQTTDMRFALLDAEQNLLGSACFPAENIQAAPLG